MEYEILYSESCGPHMNWCTGMRSCLPVNVHARGVSFTVISPLIAGENACRGFVVSTLYRIVVVLPEIVEDALNSETGAVAVA
ncbi:hypothetical protein [Microbacterium tenebrionis]|uniref:Uncharacterized protein n=1 Tax=Microbacterium tenebrionis TaxID=2830665 RepID=A0A9X1LML9_9MICO|nr:MULTISPECIES: hypothetical protein [Microbacterium]MCC2028465.1 hypothetical protein [Microbacterium tenebrionis]